MSWGEKGEGGKLERERIREQKRERVRVRERERVRVRERERVREQKRERMPLNASHQTKKIKIKRQKSYHVHTAFHASRLHRTSHVLFYLHITRHCSTSSKTQP